MTQEQINEWNKINLLHTTSHKWVMVAKTMNKHLKSQKVWNNPNAHVGGPRWVGKNEGYESWAKDNKKSKTQ